MGRVFKYEIPRCSKLLALAARVFGTCIGRADGLALYELRGVLYALPDKGQQ